MALGYFDKLAEAAVKDAIRQLEANGKRPSSRTVPAEARSLLLQKGRKRLGESDAERRVQKAIDRLKERKEIKAPTAPNNDWALVGRGPQSAARS
jgi:hypothetical protein